MLNLIFTGSGNIKLDRVYHVIIELFSSRKYVQVDTAHAEYIQYYKNKTKKAVGTYISW